MKLYDIVAADGEFVESLTQREIMNKFGLTKCRFRTFLDNSYLIDGKYWMLLCHERRDYTVFNLQGEVTVRNINKDLIDCLKNRGIVLAIDRQPDGAYEIWIRDKKTKDNVIYYLFNYEFGVIEYE